MALLAVDQLEMRFGERLIQTGVSFQVEKGTIFAIMGGSGCGKSTLLKHMIGLLHPASGHVLYNGIDYWQSDDETQSRLRAAFGMLFQSAALWSSMTLLENVCLPLEQHTTMDEAQREARAREVLEWVDLAQFAEFFPSDLSGGMKKRAGLARALVTEPEIVLFDEPTTGLDPMLGKSIHDLIRRMHDTFKFTGVIVSHDIPEVFRISANTAYDMALLTFACHSTGKRAPATCAGFLLRGADHNLKISPHTRRCGALPSACPSYRGR